MASCDKLLFSDMLGPWLFDILDKKTEHKKCPKVKNEFRKKEELKDGDKIPLCDVWSLAICRAGWDGEQKASGCLFLFGSLTHTIPCPATEDNDP